MGDFLSDEFWNERYENDEIGWDLGGVSPALKLYFDSLEDKNIAILIPGCGNAYEASYLLQEGFTNVHLLDFAQLPLDHFAEQNPDFPKANLHCEDFFIHSGEYDLIVEQTFFCALDPSLREKYAKKMAELLKPKGKLIGLLFNREFESGPPFGGTKEEYNNYFKPYFSAIKMEDCENSIEPRMGTELFIELIK